MSEQLKQHLEELKSELNNIGSDDPKLKKLAGEVDSALDQTVEVPQTLVQSMQHAVEEFEVQHPQLTAAVNNIMNSLSNIGI